jgi:hypothetical protein
MIPSNFKDILANVENAGFYQTLSMILYLIFCCYYLFRN